MKYIMSIVLMLSLLPFLSVDVRSDDLHPTLQDRKVDNYDVRSAMPTLEPANPAIQGSEARNPRDEQTPRDRQAVLCDPKFGGSPDDPGCQKPNPTPAPGGNGGEQGGGNGGQGGGGSTTSSEGGTGGGTASSGAVIVGLSKTSGVPFPITNIIGLICLAKGLILVKKSLKD